MIPIGSTVERELRKILISYIPKYYSDSHVVDEILRIDSEELETLNDDVLDVFNQFFIDKATWGLDRWEKICGLTINPGGKTLDQRRAIIKSKLRGIGVVNAALIKNISESYANGSVDVTENNINYEIVITFIGVHGVPDDLPSLENTLRNIIPAHLNIKYVFTYSTFDQLDAAAKIWNDFDSPTVYTWDEFEKILF